MWNSQSPECRTTSPNREIPATLFRPSVQNAPGKIGEASPAGYTHRKTTKRFPKDQVEWLHLRPCMAPSWCWDSRTTWDCCWPWGISSPPRDVAPRPSPEENWAGTRMKKLIIQGSIHDHAQITSSSTLSQILDFVFMTARVTCPPQNAFSNCMLCTTWWTMWKFPRCNNF